MDFEAYLQEKTFSQSTVESYLRSLAIFENWLEGRKLKAEYVTYNHLLEWLHDQQEKGYKARTKNQQLTAIRHYFDHLLQADKIPDNPAYGLYIKGVERKLPHNLLTGKQLESLYQNHKTESLQNLRDKEIVGLMVFQGLGKGELAKLQISDIDLPNGTVSVQATKRGNGRKLKLKAEQIVNLQEYLWAASRLITREKLLEIKPSKSSSLFIGGSFSHIFHNIAQRFLRSGNISSIHQIRSSVIVDWLKKHNLREVQYMAGHRYVSSTERYLQADPETLKKAVSKFHPLQ